MFNKYDAFDRVVYSVFYSGHQPIKANLKTLRNLVNAGQKEINQRLLKMEMRLQEDF